MAPHLDETVAVSPELTQKLGNTNTKPGAHPMVKEIPLQEAAGLDASTLQYEFTRQPRSVPALGSPDIWKQNIATDHMISVRWSAETGWDAPVLKPYGPLSLNPTSTALQYAIQCFEGTKLYRGHDGAMRLFRPDRNAARLLSSAQRIALPTFDPAEVVKLIIALASVDAPKWIPKDRAGTFLYVRPSLISTSESVAVRKASEALLMIILVCYPPFDEPEGSLSPTERRAGTEAGVRKRPGVRLLASDDDTVRAWPGGFGNAKVGANYAPSLPASSAAIARGYDQILWLFGDEDFVTEAGASNFFAVIRHEDSGRPQLITAPLTDRLILPGVTRDSILQIAREQLSDELDVVERRFTIHELIRAADEGRLGECFAAGTVFFISAISDITYKDRTIEVPQEGDGLFGPVAQKLRTIVRAIHYGGTEHPWALKVEERGVQL